MQIRYDTVTNIISYTMSAHCIPLLHSYLQLNHTNRMLLSHKHAKQHFAHSYFLTQNIAKRIRNLNCSKVSAASPNAQTKRYCHTSGPQKGLRDWIFYILHFMLFTFFMKSLLVFSYHRCTKSTLSYLWINLLFSTLFTFTCLINIAWKRT